MVGRINVRVRIYRPEDREEVSKIFREGIVGPGSPCDQFIRSYWKVSWFLYAASIAGVGLRHSTIPDVLCWILIVLPLLTSFGLHRYVNSAFQLYVDEALKNDMSDICTHYQLERSEEGEWIARSVGCFWVALSHSGRIIGFVGLDPNPENAPPRSVELRHMSVSYNFRGHGVAKTLLQTLTKFCEEHKKDVDQIILSTSEYQAPARRLYEKAGFEHAKTEIISALKVTMHHYRMPLKK